MEQERHNGGVRDDQPTPNQQLSWGQATAKPGQNNRANRDSGEYRVSEARPMPTQSNCANQKDKCDQDPA